MTNCNKINLIEAVKVRATCLKGSFTADNIYLLGAREAEERMSAKLRGIEYVGTDYAFLASCVANAMEALWGETWQFNTGQVIELIEAEAQS
ncbi:hypothetical protein N9P29_01355 [bacterium]|nr:hypothetical protein [bacterium]